MHHRVLLFSGTCSALNLVSYSKQMLMFHCHSFSSSDNIIHSIWGNCVYFYFFHFIFLSVFNFDVHGSAWTLILKYIRISQHSEKKTAWRKLGFLWPGMGLRGIWDLNTFFFWLSVCVWILWSKLEVICIKNIYIFAHWDYTRGQKLQAESWSQHFIISRVSQNAAWRLKL